MFEKERHTVPNTQLNATWTHLKLFFQHCVDAGFGQSGAPVKSFVTFMVRSLLGRGRTRPAPGRSFSPTIRTTSAREVVRSSSATRNAKVRFLTKTFIFNPCANSSEPFAFGNWTSTLYCNDTCGSNSFYLEWRSCTPASPNLPEGYSCNSLGWSQTHRPGNKACPDMPLCPGNFIRQTAWLNLFYSRGLG